MVIVNDTAVRADRNIDACLLIVFVTCLADIDKSRSLTASDTLRLTGDADGAAADTDLDEICSCLCEEQEAFTVNNIARANLYLRSELLMNVVKSNALPLGISLRGINAESINACIKKKRNTLSIVTRIDTCAYTIAFIFVNELILKLLILRVILAENHIHEALVLVNEREHVELAFPDDVVSFRKSRACICIDELFKWSHELRYRCIHGHACYTIVTARNNTQKLSRRRTILGNRHRRMSGDFLERENFTKCSRRLDVGIAGNKSGFIALYLFDHLSFLLRCLRAIQEGKTSFLCQRDCHPVIRNGLHDSRYHRDIKAECRLFAFLEFCQRCFQ